MFKIVNKFNHLSRFKISIHNILRRDDKNLVFLCRQIFTTPVQNELSNYSHKYYFNMSSKHLAEGSLYPPLSKGKLRILSMRFCPYAQRAVLVVLAKGIPHDVVNCNLKQKPEWLLARNINGKVPVLEFPDGKILFESLIVADYVDETYKDRPLRSPDPYQKSLDRLWIQEFNKVISLFYKILFTNKSGDTDALNTHVQRMKLELKRFDQELARRKTKFYGGENLPGMMDYMIWPWVERFPAVSKFISDSILNFEEENPNLESWIKEMSQDPTVKEFFLPPDVHKQFIDGFLAGNINYDILEKDN